MSENKFKKFEIDFIEKIAENLASVCFNIQNTEKSKNLLIESELREQVLKEQEEELRQNMEELVATQEAMESKQKALDQKSDMMKLIIDNIPFPVFVKDEIGRYILVNKAEAALDSVLPIELPEQSFTTMNGVTHIFKTTKIPFVNSLRGKKNILGVSVDLTEIVKLENKLKEVHST